MSLNFVIDERLRMALGLEASGNGAFLNITFTATSPAGEPILLPVSKKVNAEIFEPLRLTAFNELKQTDIWKRLGHLYAEANRSRAKDEERAAKITQLENERQRLEKSTESGLADRLTTIDAELADLRNKQPAGMVLAPLSKKAKEEIEKEILRIVTDHVRTKTKELDGRRAETLKALAVRECAVLNGLTEIEVGLSELRTGNMMDRLKAELRQEIEPPAEEVEPQTSVLGPNFTRPKRKKEMARS